MRWQITVGLTVALGLLVACGGGETFTVDMRLLYSAERCGNCSADQIPVAEGSLLALIIVDGGGEVLAERCLVLDGSITLSGLTDVLNNSEFRGIELPAGRAASAELLAYEPGEQCGELPAGTIVFSATSQFVELTGAATLDLELQCEAAPSCGSLRP